MIYTDNENNMFDIWNEEKKSLNKKEQKWIGIETREIRFVKLWKNIWTEQDGKIWFMRPFLVVKRIGNLFRWVPLTSGGKNNQWYYTLPQSIIFAQKDRRDIMRICLSQAKLLDKKRFSHKIGKIWGDIFDDIKKLLKNMYF